MRPSQITQVILRLFALPWFIQGLFLLVEPLTRLYAPIQLAMTILLWFAAPSIARLITKENDEATVIESITFYQLLVAMFIGLGVYFCASSVATMLNVGHSYFLLQTSPETTVQIPYSFYDFTQQAVTFGAGLILIFTAKKWASKIAANS